MRVLVIVHGFPPNATGGTEIYAAAHARGLQRAGDEVLVLTREHDPSRPDYAVREDVYDGLRIVRINNTFRAVRSFRDTYVNPAIDAVARRAIDTFTPDVAHIHHLTGLSIGVVALLAERNIPRVMTLHDYWLLCHRGQLLDVEYRVCAGPEPDGCGACIGAAAARPLAYAGASLVRSMEDRLPDRPARLLRGAAARVAGAVLRTGSQDEARARLQDMRQVCGLVTQFIAPSHHMRDRFVQFGVPPDRITAADNGTDPASFARVARAPSMRLRLAFVGSLMVSKAPHLLLEAAHRLPPGRVTVDLAGAFVPYHGDDSYRRRLEPLLQHDAVRARGIIPHDQMPNFLANIDVVVVPSIWPENSPLVIHEAFLARAPVVASRIGGIPEFVRDGVNGLLFEPGDAVDLARALSRLLDERDLLERLRAGIGPLRTLADDIASTRTLYWALRERAAPYERPDSGTVAPIVLNFRTPDETAMAARSLLASRHRLADILVVNNDGNNDDLHAINTLPPSVLCLQTGANLGYSGGMNVGIRAALATDAAYVLLVNSDVIVPPDCVGTLVQTMASAPDVGIVGPAIFYRSTPERVMSLGMRYQLATGRMRHVGAEREAAFDGTEQPREVDGVTGCVMLVRARVFRDIGLLDERYFFGFEDLEFCLRARRSGWRTLVDPRARAYHEGGRSIGRASPRRLYFAARNHLLVARQAAPDVSRVAASLRTCHIVGLNLVHALLATGSSPARRVAAVLKGSADYARGRFGA